VRMIVALRAFHADAEKSAGHCNGHAVEAFLLVACSQPDAEKERGRLRGAIHWQEQLSRQFVPRLILSKAVTEVLAKLFEAQTGVGRFAVHPAVQDVAPICRHFPVSEQALDELALL